MTESPPPPNPLAVYRTGFTQRYHGNAEMAWMGQTNGHHQWSVAVLLLTLWPDTPLDAVREALLHDTGETGACDMSAPAKQKYPEAAAAILTAELRERAEMGVPEVENLSDRQWRRIKFCDRLERYLFAKTRAPWVLFRDGWPQLRTQLMKDARSLHVKDVVERMLA